MSAAAAAFPLPKGIGAEWVKDPIDIETWPKAARRVYRFLKRRIRMRKAEHRHKDREIGQEIGEMEGGTAPHRRTIQRGLKWLQDLGGIFRDHSDGHGRVIKVLLPLAGDGQERERPAPAEKAKAGPKGQSGPAAAPAAPCPPPPADAPEPPADPDADGPATAAAWRAEIARIAAEADRARAAESPQEGSLPRKVIKGVDNDDLAYLELKEKMGELTGSERARLDAARRDRAP